VLSTVEALPHLAWISDPTGRAVYFNRAGVELTGVTRAELRGSGWATVVHPDDLQRAVRDWVEAVRCDQPLHGEYRIRDRHGGYHSTIGHAAPLGTGDLARYWLGTVITNAETARRIEIPDVEAPDGPVHDWSQIVRDAVDRDALICAAQPIVPIAGGRSSEELLVRLPSPSGGVIAPDVFLPSIEASGAVVALDRWMLCRAVERAAAGVRVHVNISARSLDDGELIDRIPELLDERMVTAGTLVFELTETASVRDLDRARRFAAMLADLGCGLALDDFGSGYAGFAQLAELPVNYLKISHEFVTDLRTNPCHRHIVDIVVQLAERFGCETVAEGVEDEPTLRLLRRCGVDYVQGSYLGRPTELANRETVHV
jgi:PAS domain S-box-containing protein